MAIKERRSDTRQRTRLRPGKLIGIDGRFLADAAIVDIGASGLRVKLFGSVPNDARVVLLDEREAKRWPAQRIWTSGDLAGFRFEAGPRTPRRDEMLQLAGPYYATR